jgi:hypothetical protein
MQQASERYLTQEPVHKRGVMGVEEPSVDGGDDGKLSTAALEELRF